MKTPFELLQDAYDRGVRDGIQMRQLRERRTLHAVFFSLQGFLIGVSLAYIVYLLLN